MCNFFYGLSYHIPKLANITAFSTDWIALISFFFRKFAVEKICLLLFEA